MAFFLDGFFAYWLLHSPTTERCILDAAAARLGPVNRLTDSDVGAE
jgi:hypothetical protein